MLKIQIKFVSGKLEGKCLDIFLHDAQKGYVSLQEGKLVTGNKTSAYNGYRLDVRTGKVFLNFSGFKPDKYFTHEPLRNTELKSGMLMSLFNCKATIQVTKIIMADTRISQL